MNAPVGPTGLPETCRGGTDESPAARFRLGVSAGVSATDLTFGTGPGAAIHEKSLGASLAWRASRRWTLSASAGALTGGFLWPAGQPGLTLLPGPFGAVAGTFRILEGGKGLPFLTATASASLLATQTQDAAGATTPLLATDVKAAAIVGITLWDRLSPYVGAAAFGGPVLWGPSDHRNTGTDNYHYQVLIGLSAALPAGLDAFLEGSPVGERALTGGLGYAF